MNSFFLNCLEFACCLSAIALSLRISNRIARHEPHRISLLNADSQPQLFDKAQPEFVYVALSWMGIGVCELLLPHPAWRTVFYGFLFVFWLALGTLSVYLRRK